MLITQSFRAVQPNATLDACNLESGRIYTTTMVTHWRIYRHHGHWLSPYSAMRLNDVLGGATSLHAHSRDAAQEGFYKACKTSRTLKKQGNEDIRYPWKRKRFRTTTWKSTGIRHKDGVLLLARARGLEPVRVVLPPWLLGMTILEVRLVYNPKAKHYAWHVVVDDRLTAPVAPGVGTVAVDLGEVHPAAACDAQEAVVFSARALRSRVQGRNKGLATLAAMQSRCTKGSRRCRRLQHEAYTSQTCPGCQTRHKPKGRTYRCPACSFVGHRDGQVGAANILSAALHGEPGHILVPSTKYRHPFVTGKRSRLDTAHVAALEESRAEAAGL